MGLFPEAQWQLTPHALVGFCQILNPSEIFMVVLVTCIKKIQSEQKRLLYSQDFSHYNLLPLKPEF